MAIFSILCAVFLSLLWSGLALSCHTNGSIFVPYTKGLSCIAIVSDPMLNYTQALDYIANNLSLNVNENLSILSLRDEQSLDAQVLSLYAAGKTVERMWIASNCSVNCTGINCFSFNTNRSIETINCNESLPFVVIMSYDIIVANESTSEVVYVTDSVTIKVPDNVTIDASFNTKWFHNGLPLRQFNNDTRTLSFDPFIPQNHSGIYQLVVSNILQSVIVFMVQLQEAVIREFTVPPANVTIPIGQIAVLECQSGLSLPFPTITWTYTNSSGSYPINQLDPIRYHITPLDTLYIREVTVHDSGVYLCTASNVAGNMSASALLNVTTEPLINVSEVTISQSPRNQSVFVGEDYHIECNIMIRTPQSVDPTRVTSTIYYTYREIPSQQGQIAARRSVFYYSLMVKNFPSMTFTGQQEGEDQFYCTMNVNLQEQGQTHVLDTSIATITIQVRASITALFTNHSGASIPNGTAVDVYCDFTGPSVNWYLNGHPYNEHTSSLTNNGGMRSTITIQSFTHSHIGTYQCMTNNNHYAMKYRSLTLGLRDGIPGKVSFNVTAITTSVINITIIPPNNTNTLLLQYQVQYRSIQSLVPVGNFITIGPQLNSHFTLSGLLSDTLYQINLQAYTLAGFSEDNMQIIRTAIEPTGKASSSSPLIVPTSTTAVTKDSTTVASRPSVLIVSSIIIRPTVIPLAPSRNGTPVSTIALSVILCVIILVITVIVMGVVLQRCWWYYSGLKGNYSPEKVEEMHQRKAMLNFEPQPVTPPAVGYDNTDIDSLASSVEVIRVDQFNKSTDRIFTYDSTDTLQSQTVGL